MYTFRLLLALGITVATHTGFAQFNNSPMLNSPGRVNEYQALEYDNQPYLNKEFKPGIVRLADGRVYQGQLNFNAYTGQPEQLMKGVAYTIEMLIKEFRLGDSTVIFRSGFAPVDKQNANSFYQVLYDGKTKLLEYHYAKTQELKKFNDANVHIKFNLDTDHYLVKTDGSLVRIKRDKKSILAALKDKASEMEAYFSKQPKLGNWQEVSQAIAYYDGL
ncbi:hypothetical protein [Siphonobacter curvatus]|uniref:Uncharacterized protein n=1 Tax=Siphonobacter curvatus TaxID=2094562 RepID=A0A2S7IKK2_9BACT|nr:hypothetical protein [Siphonobacter curvatus]PQA58205.1 hypothetical protein C5O19_00570 [Siphonobacter curvatus]